MNDVGSSGSLRSATTHLYMKWVEASNGRGIENGMCLVLFERPKPIERGDFDDGTAHIALQTSNEDFNRAVGELKKAGVKVLIDKPVERPMGEGTLLFRYRGELYTAPLP
jgi:hypothetical protein